MNFLPSWFAPPEPIKDAPEIAKLKSFSTLQKGWHYGRGGPISSDVIAQAQSINSFYRLVGFTRTNFFPGANGEVLATAYRRDDYIGATIEPDGSHSLVYEIAKKEILCIENRDLRTIKNSILQIADKIWNISGSSIPVTMTMIAASSMIWHLRTPKTEDYLYSKYRAQSAIA